jgi:hypothetical protein
MLLQNTGTYKSTWCYRFRRSMVYFNAEISANLCSTPNTVKIIDSSVNYCKHMFRCKYNKLIKNSTQILMSHNLQTSSYPLLNFVLVDVICWRNNKISQ